MLQLLLKHFVCNSYFPFSSRLFNSLKQYQKLLYSFRTSDLDHNSQLSLDV